MFWLTEKTLLTHIVSLEPERLSTVRTDFSLTSNTSNLSGSLQESDLLERADYIYICVILLSPSTYAYSLLSVNTV